MKRTDILNISLIGLVVITAILLIYSLTTVRSEEEIQLYEMLEYQLTQGKDARIEGGIIIIRNNGGKILDYE